VSRRAPSPPCRSEKVKDRERWRNDFLPFPPSPSLFSRQPKELERVKRISPSPPFFLFPSTIKTIAETEETGLPMASLPFFFFSRSPPFGSANGVRFLLFLPSFFFFLPQSADPDLILGWRAPTFPVFPRFSPSFFFSLLSFFARQMLGWVSTIRPGVTHSFFPYEIRSKKLHSLAIVPAPFFFLSLPSFFPAFAEAIESFTREEVNLITPKQTFSLPLSPSLLLPLACEKENSPRGRNERPDCLLLPSPLSYLIH